MSDQEYHRAGDYKPHEDPELIRAIENALNRWKQGDDGEVIERGTILTKFLVIAVAEGWDDDGKPVNQVMIAPKGSHEDMLGLCAGADTRFRAEIVASILESGPE